MYLTRVQPSIMCKNTLWMYLELTLSSYPLSELGAQFLPNAEMVWRVHYLISIEATVAPTGLWKLYP